ncbi:unnamed protein product [Mytilus edulis]|uniref:PHD-type domain-containing protein n=1 Tax=Mytilus edulis TaxID=6550 RepID=A0A8S3Q741_MYTED|nr:unnamed protein product [Mytilus edulis]
MELSRRIRRSRVNRVPLTPSKLKSIGAKVDTVNLTVLTVDYELDRRKAMKNKIEAASRPHSEILSMARGNIVIASSAAAYEEFKTVDNTACANEPLIGPQFPLCLVCNKQCDENPTSVACDICNQWIHLKCEGLTPEKVSEIELNDESYICRLCTNQRVNSDMETNINHDNIVVNTSVCQENLNNNTESVGQTPLTRTFELKENCQPTVMTESLLDQVNTLPSGPNMANSPDNTELHKAEIAHLQTQIEKRDKLLKVKDSKILKYESEIDQLKKQLSTNRAYSITLEDKNKDLQHSLLIINQRVEQLENYPTQGSTNSHTCTQNVQSTPQSEIGEMKIWFLEQKVRQLELDVHKNNTELSLIKNSHVPHVKTSRGKKRRKPYMPNNNNKTHAQSASLHNICHQMDDFLLNTRSDETISVKSCDENSDFLGAHSPPKVRLKIFRPKHVSTNMTKTSQCLSPPSYQQRQSVFNQQHQNHQNLHFIQPITRLHLEKEKPIRHTQSQQTRL